jgi:hypothetical protein
MSASGHTFSKTRAAALVASFLITPSIVFVVADYPCAKGQAVLVASVAR